jgi:trigger factor
MPDKAKPEGHQQKPHHLAEQATSHEHHHDEGAAEHQHHHHHHDHEHEHHAHPHEHEHGHGHEHAHEEAEEGGLATATDEKPKRINQEVAIREAGPCRKHIKVTIPREDLDERFNTKFSELVGDANVPGYRPGKAPRKLIEKRFYKDVSEQLRAEVLMQSLEQLVEDHKLMPLAEPDLDPFKIELPKTGPLEYEFEVEVAPEFELPEYKGLKLKRPTRPITEQDVSRETDTFISGQFGKLEDKAGAAAMGDYLRGTMTISLAGKEVNAFEDRYFKVDKKLAFRDGVVNDFASKVLGAKAGDVRELKLTFTPSVGEPGLVGKSADAKIKVAQVQKVVIPEITPELLDERVGVSNMDQLREKVRGVLKRQLEYKQRQAARQQVLDLIAAASRWELPRDLLNRQTRKTLQRKVMEMRSAGFSEPEIRRRATLLQQDAMASTERGLKEHFVLQKIAETEKIEVTDNDIDFEIEMMAEQSGESPRRVKARLQKDDLLETLATQILEAKTLNLVLDAAEYEDVPMPEEEDRDMEAVEEQAMPTPEAANPPVAAAQG